LGGGVFTASGTQTLVLYHLGQRVLVHGQTASTLLTIRTPGVLMQGRGVSADGSTFRSTWHCVAKPYTSAIHAVRPARLVC
jgi:hypothetical protein